VDHRAFTAPGELVSANGSNYHVRRFGETGPLILLECGLTMMSACWGWIAPELGQFARVIAYDRAGLGWSDEREGLRDARALAEELIALLGALKIDEQLFLAGHSMGAICNRALLRLHRECARGMIWLDPAHPEQIHKRGIRRRMRNLVFYIEAAHLLAKGGIPAIEVPLIQHLDALPEQDFRALRRFLRNPRHLRTSAREARVWESSAEFLRSERAVTVPLLVLSAQKSALPGWNGLQRELAGFSRESRHLTFPEMSHISMLANREHATRIVAEIRGFLNGRSL
jgi:pimeloyl-ACP methyl ester carboxylesterase